MKHFLIYALFLLIGCSATARDKPNIVFIMADDLGYTDLGVTGSDYYKTPNIDKFAAQSLWLTDAYANCANCAPTRAALMSGMYAPRTGVYTVGNPDRGNAKDRMLIPSPNKTELDSGFVTLAEMLKAAGYTTAMMGKWHLGDGETGPSNQGFDYVPAYGHGVRSFFAPYGRPFDNKAPKDEYITERLANEAIDFLKMQQDADQPFFLYLPFFSVHTPIDPLPELVEQAKQRPKGKYHNQPKYAGFVASLDRHVGKVLDALDELELSDDTIVVFTSDNGGHHTYTDVYPYRAGKGAFYEGGIRVPLFVRYPGVTKAGAKRDEPVILLDFYPTFAELANAKLAKDQPVDGVSLLPVLHESGGSLQREAIYWHFPAYLQAYAGGRDETPDPKFRARPCSVVRMGDWKLIQYFETGKVELFNLVKDPGEQNDLSKKEVVKAIELTALLKVWQKETNAPVPTEKNPKYKP